MIDWSDYNPAVVRAYIPRNHNYKKVPTEGGGECFAVSSFREPFQLFTGAQITECSYEVLKSASRKITEFAQAKSSEKWLAVAPTDSSKHYILATNRCLVEVIAETAIIISGHTQKEVDRTTRKLGLPLEEKV